MKNEIVPGGRQGSIERLPSKTAQVLANNSFDLNRMTSAGDKQ